jgi:arsenate reductase
MAEAWARHLKGDSIDPYSAGTQPKRIDPLAVQAMAEVGIDIAGQPSKSIIDVEHIPFDYVVTVCSDAHETCPVFPGHAKVIHIGFDDPPKLAAQDTPDNAIKHYRRIRDEIRAFVEQLPKALFSQTISPDPV